eukprot:4875277-Pyramimonas_sp.AAC.1
MSVCRPLRAYRFFHPELAAKRHREGALIIRPIDRIENKGGWTIKGADYGSYRILPVGTVVCWYSVGTV